MADIRFKKCSYCKAILSIRDIVHNPEIVPIGITFADDTIDGAYYFFQHETPNCGTSFVLPVQSLRQFIIEPIPAENLAPSDRCPRHCASLRDLSVCRIECFFAPYRRFLLKMVALKREAAHQTIGSSANR